MVELKQIGKVFVQGLVVTVPLVLTLVVLNWLGGLLSGLMNPLIRVVYAPATDVPGLGILLAVGFVFLVGALIHLWVVRVAVEWLEDLLTSIPLVKSVYGSLKDILQFITGSGKQNFQRVVLVEPFSDDEMKVLGLVTREEFENWDETTVSEDAIAVFMPMSYQFGGYTVILSDEQVTELDMSLEDGIRFALTAGVTGDHRTDSVTPET